MGRWKNIPRFHYLSICNFPYLLNLREKTCSKLLHNIPKWLRNSKDFYLFAMLIYISKYHVLYGNLLVSYKIVFIYSHISIKIIMYCIYHVLYLLYVLYLPCIVFTMCLVRDSFAVRRLLWTCCSRGTPATASPQKPSNSIVRDSSDV